MGDVTHAYEGVDAEGGYRGGNLIQGETPTDAVSRAYREGWRWFRVSTPDRSRCVASLAKVR